MKSIYLTGAILTIASTFLSQKADAQTVIDLRFTQNPLFEVSTNSVATALPGDGTPLTLGGDLTVAGGSGTYTYQWKDTSGATLGSNATLAVSTPGTYLLTISDQCDCAQEVTFSVEAAGIDATTVTGIRIFTDGTDLHIEGAEATQATAFTPTGVMAALFTPTDPTSVFDLGSLQPGIYVIQIVTTANSLLIYKTQI